MIKRLLKKYGALPLVLGAVVGAGFVLAGNAALEYTNTESFCISCHEMEANAYYEYQDTIHDLNRTGNRTTCPDCHVPKEFFPKIWRKTVATKELWYHLMGKLDTTEKYNEHRYELALRVWKRLKANDSKACRNCHEVDAMDPDKQSERAVARHEEMETEGKTCIDCHYAIAHFEPLEGDLVPEDL